ncbi:epididymal protein 13 [Tenrec ecaudatus]|uniref:epididymal protein 13 n=1 Tax=Tenrec ecaudatus TaxID=94439 RepID=UPI003F5A5111
MLRSEPFLKISLLILLFPGLAETCIPREGLLSLQVLNEETSDCKEGKSVEPCLSGSCHPIKVLPKKKNSWNVLKCIYMMVTFLFVSYNKGDWCYCHYCNPDADFRYVQVGQVE